MDFAGNDLGDLILAPTNYFQPLRCPCSDDSDAMMAILEQTFRMIMMKNNTLVSCCHETAMQWEITDNTVQLVRCIIKPGNSLLISNLLSLEDGVHFLLLQVDGAQTIVSVHNIESHAPVYEVTLDFVTVEVLPLSVHHFLGLHCQPDLLVYSLRKPGHCIEMYLQDIEYVSLNKLPGVDNIVIILYTHYLDIWKITEETYNQICHYEFHVVKKAVEMGVIDCTKALVTCEEAGLQGEILLGFSDLKVVSESLISDKIEGEFVSPISSSCIIIMSSGTDRMGLYIENFMVQSLAKNQSSKLAVGLYDDERYSLFCFFFPCTLCIIVFTTHGKFFKCQVKQDLVNHIQYAELRKNARILAQAHRTLSSDFQTVPVEICCKIISFTDQNIPAKKARSIAALYFCKPHSKEIDPNILSVSAPSINAY